MISMKIKRSLDYDVDGGGLQYTVDNGETWKYVGKEKDGGQNWFNSNRISDYRGDWWTGWTSADRFSEEDQEWVSVAHHLDSVAGEREVRFRILFRSQGQKTLVREGFAFDSVAITQRTRLTVLEHFTNAYSPSSPDADDLIAGIRRAKADDVIDIQYHTDNPQPDRMFLDNQIISNSRGLFYNNTRVPYAVLDGGPYDNFLDAERKYNFNDRTPSVEDVHSRSLTPPDFHIDIDVDVDVDEDMLETSMNVYVSINALKNLPARDLTLYTIVIQDTVDDARYAGSNGQTVFRNVARKLLPNVGGIQLKNSWNIFDDPVIKLIPWDPVESWMDTSRMSIVAFIQEDLTKEILQAATTQEYNPGLGTSESAVMDEVNILLYPNPAADYINVYFEESPKEDLNLRIYNMSGRMVHDERVGEGENHHTVRISHLPDGLYIIEFRNARNGVPIFRGKFLHY
jgi:hypothetical protein